MTWPILVMVSFGGLFGSSTTTPFFLYGFVQYFSNSPSLIHFRRERTSDSAKTPLCYLMSVCMAGKSTISGPDTGSVRTFQRPTGTPSPEGFLAEVLRQSVAVCRLESP